MSVFTQEIDFSSLSPPIILEPKNIGFQATAVYIYNYTAYWIYLPGAEVYIPPFWADACRFLTHTTDYTYVEIKTPANIEQNPTVSSYVLRLTWTSEPAIYSEGSNLNPTPPVGADPIVPPLLIPTYRTKLKTVMIALSYITAKYGDVTAGITNWALQGRITIGIHNTGPGIIKCGDAINLSLPTPEGFTVAVDGYYFLDATDQLTIMAISDTNNTLIEIAEF